MHSNEGDWGFATSLKENLRNSLKPDEFFVMTFLVMNVVMMVRGAASRQLFEMLSMYAIIFISVALCLFLQIDVD